MSIIASQVGGNLPVCTDRMFSNIKQKKEQTLGQPGFLQDAFTEVGKIPVSVSYTHLKEDRDIVVLCSDSRGSASLSGFAEAFPTQFFEMGIAEQSLVSTAAGLARGGKKPFAASPACFLSTRSMEQVKVDVAYSRTNVKLIGISGGVSYGALGMTHHSAQDIACLLYTSRCV